MFPTYKYYCRIINRKKKLPEDKEPDLLEIKKKSHPKKNQICLK